MSQKLPPDQGHGNESTPERDAPYAVNGNTTATTSARRRASRAGTRNVHTLNPEQLEKKRANDREAQRSIRQRTKNTILDLESRIEELQELLSQQDGEKEERITSLRTRNRELEVELARLEFRKQSLETGSLVGEHDDEEYPLRKQHSRSENPPMLPTSNPYPRRPQTLQRTTSYPSQGSENPWQTHVPAALDTTMSARNSMSPAFGMDHDSSLQMMGHPHSGPHSPFEQSIGYLSSSQSASWGTVSSQSLTMENGRSNSSPRYQMPNSILTYSSAPLSAASVFDNPQELPCNIPLKLLEPSCAVDIVLYNLIAEQQALVRIGAPEIQTIGPYEVSLKALFDPKNPIQTHRISSALSGLLMGTFLRGLPERIACLYIMYRLAQWQILPQKSTYDRLPDFYSPRPSQLITPHPAWATQMPFGKLKDMLIDNQAKYATDEFQVLYTSSLNLNWPYSDEECVLYQGNDVFISEAFEKHVNKLSNWSLDIPFQQRYPELGEFCRFTDYAPMMM